MKTSPAPSTARPNGRFSPEATRVETVPVAACHSLRVLLMLSARKTLPAASTATAIGLLSPGERRVEGGDGPGRGVPLLERVVEGVGDEDVAHGVHRHAPWLVQPGGDKGDGLGRDVSAAGLGDGDLLAEHGEVRRPAGAGIRGE